MAQAHLGVGRSTVGAGSFAKVYNHKKDADLVVKRTLTVADSAILHKEYQVYQALDKALGGMKPLKLVQVMPCKQWKKYQDGSAEIVLTKIKRLAKTKELGTKTNHALFGCARVKCEGMEESGSQVNVRRKQLMDLVFPKPKVYQRALREIGQLLARIHFVAEYTTGHMDVLVGRTHHQRVAHVYFGDFDKSDPITEWKKQTIQEIASSMLREPYFPHPSTHKDDYEIFAKAYLSEARKAKHTRHAKAILAAYVAK